MNKEELKKLLAEVESDKDAEGKEEEKVSKVEAKSTAEDLVDKLGDKIASVIKEARGDEKEAEQVRSELFNAKDGVKGIQYPSTKELANLEDDEKIVVFFKAMITRKEDPEADKIFKALTEGTNADGGYLVPAPLATEIWRVLPDMSVMRRIARTMPMQSRTLAMNSTTATPTAYWIGEAETKTTTSVEFSQRTLTAYKLVARVLASHELIQDANIDLVRYIIELFAEAIAEAEDKAFFTGSGTGQPTGINQETLNSQSAGASLDFDDVIDLIDLIPQSARRSPSTAFVCNQQVIKLLRKVKDSDGGYIWRNGAGRTSGQVERLPDTVYGYPVWEQNHLSQDELYFGDWRNYIIGDRKQLTVETTNEGGDAWAKDLTDIKAVERVGGIAVITTPFAKLTDV